jgi:hypothetical protein
MTKITSFTRELPDGERGVMGEFAEAVKKFSDKTGIQVFVFMAEMDVQNDEAEVMGMDAMQVGCVCHNMSEASAHFMGEHLAGMGEHLAGMGEFKDKVIDGFVQRTKEAESEEQEFTTNNISPNSTKH